MAKREIKAHKGGRTERVYARLSPAEKAELGKELERKQMSFSDWVMWKLRGGKSKTG